MKTLKKLLAVTLCMAMLVFVVAGCGASGNKTCETTGSTVSASTSAQVQTTEKDEEPVVLKLLGITWGDYLQDAPGNVRIHDVLKEKLNIDIQATLLQKPDDWPASVNLAIASGEAYDMMQMEGNMTLYHQLIDDNYIIPLDDLLSQNGKNILAVADPSIWDFLRVNGKVYALCNEGDPTANNVLIRKDLLDKNGLSVPTTIDEFEKALLTLKEKENTEGFVMYMDNLDTTFAGSFIETGGSNFLSTDNKITPAFLHKNYKDYLAVMQRFYKEGIIPKDFMTMKYEQADNLVQGGKASVFTLYGFSYTAESIQSMTKNIPTLELAAVKPLKGTIEGSYMKGASLVSDMNVITKNCKRPDKAMEYANFVAGTKEGWALTGYGEEGKDYFVKSKDDKSIIIDPSKPSIFTGADKYYSIYRFSAWSKIRASVMKDGNQQWLENLKTYKLNQGPEYGMMFDISSMKSKDKQTDLTDYFQQERFKVIMGQTSVDDWDKVCQTWLDKGGSIYIDDMTEQYNKWKQNQ